MIIEKPEVIADGLYNQRQTAEALKVDRHTIARYEADGLIKFRIRKAGKRKVTTGAEIMKCWKSTII
jgi:predicted site-specific integrase-resolvase